MFLNLIYTFNFIFKKLSFSLPKNQLYQWFYMVVKIPPFWNNELIVKFFFLTQRSNLTNIMRETGMESRSPGSGHSVVASTQNLNQIQAHTLIYAWYLI